MSIATAALRILRRAVMMRKVPGRVAQEPQKSNEAAVTAMTRIWIETLTTMKE